MQIEILFSILISVFISTVVNSTLSSRDYVYSLSAADSTEDYYVYDVLYRAKRSPDLSHEFGTNDYQKHTEREKIYFPVWDDAKGEYREDEQELATRL